MKNLRLNQTVVLNRYGKRFIAKVIDVFTDGFGLLLNHNPNFFQSKEIDGKIYGVAFAFDHELTENKTGLTIK